MKAEISLPGARALLLSLSFLGVWSPLAGASQISVLRDERGIRLQVDGKDWMVRGMNWDYIPVGQNYSFDLWSKPDDFIRAALDRDMGLLEDMGVNAIRQYPGIPPRWVRYIHERYGIFTAINPLVGRYGFSLGGAWYPAVNYQDPRMRAALKADTLAAVATYRDVPGVLMWILGNESNYGLEWTSNEIENLPQGERQRAKARHLYSLYGEIIDEIKKRDPGHPITIANGDVQYLDLIAEHCPGLDIFGTNVYRGISARDLFDVVRDKLGLPVLFTEFGADAYDARAGREDSLAQARLLLGQWQEIYEQTAGHGKAGNAIGGFVFQWTDGWWKHKQEVNLDVHDPTASWSNGGYSFDFVEGQNNMNEEWFGISAKGQPTPEGLYRVYPREAYFALREAFRLDPYAAETSAEKIQETFAGITPARYSGESQACRLEERVERLERIEHINLRMDLQTIASGGNHAWTLPDRKTVPPTVDHLESFFLDLRARPAASLSGTLSLNVLGNVPQNKIDEIFFERRGRPIRVTDADGEPLTLQGVERIKVYQASFLWESDWADVEGTYRTGHNHWGYEGDFFGLYREAYYQESVDLYNADVPYGMVVSGKQKLTGLKIAFGPQIYWGANPTLIAKYTLPISSRFTLTAMHQEDLASQSGAQSSLAIPEQMTRRTALHLACQLGDLRLDLGALWAGSEKVDRWYVLAEKTSGPSYADSGYQVERDRIAPSDTLGAKLKLTWKLGKLQWYAQGAYKGLVADAGPDATVTFVGWSLKESGRGNQVSSATGLVIPFGPLQIAPNLLYQKPLVGPMPRIQGGIGAETGRLYPSLEARNILRDPFTVLDNRETLGLELLLVYDPTPATWFWMWDNEVKENAKFAGSLDFVYRLQPTRRDSKLAFLEDGTMFSFGEAPKARDEWEVTARMIFNPASEWRILSRLYVRLQQANTPKSRLEPHYGLDARLGWKRALLGLMVKIDDFGPYDYHRDYDLTFPVQAMADASYGFVLPRLGQPYTRIGLRYQFRTLDKHSPRYPYAAGAQDPADIHDVRLGEEWEATTYLSFSL